MNEDLPQLFRIPKVLRKELSIMSDIMSQGKYSMTCVEAKNRSLAMARICKQLLPLRTSCRIRCQHACDITYLKCKKQSLQDSNKDSPILEKHCSHMTLIPT